MNHFDIEEKYLDIVLVPCGLLVLGVYHCWLLIIIKRYPKWTVIGLNSASRHRWVYHMMSDPQKNGILAVQTIRNNLMASTLLATISITLSSLITAFVSSSSTSTSSVYNIHTAKYFAVLVCFLAAFLCNMQCVRYYAHVSFLVNVPPLEDGEDYIEYVAQKLNRGSLFWSLGLRAFYFSFPLLLWIFGPIAMFACSCVMVFLLYFLDTAKTAPRHLQNGHVHEKNHDFRDVESARCNTREAAHSGGLNLYSPLLGSNKSCSASD